MKKKLLTVISLGIAACWIGLAIAGNINHGGNPADGSGMPTLQEIFDYLVNATPETVNTAFQEPAGAPGPTGKTTREIYDAVKAERDTDLVAGNIKNGVEIFGVTGTFAGGSTFNAAIPKTGQTAQVTVGDDGDLEKGAVLPTPRFGPANADGSVTDNLTGLIWGPDANLMPTRDVGYDLDGTGGDDGKVFWLTAMNYVAKLNTENYLGHADWRLPNVRELHSLIHFGYNNPTLTNDAGNAKWDTSGVSSFSNVKSGYYWSSTSYSVSTTIAWNVDMYYGYVGNGPKAFNDYYVWPVRGGHNRSFDSLVIWAL